MTPGRPNGFRRCVRLAAISLRCHAGIVSGVAIVAILPRAFRPSGFPFDGQPSTLVVGKMQSLLARFELLLQDAVLFDQIGDHGRSLAAGPASESSQEKLKMDGASHW